MTKVLVAESAPGAREIISEILSSGMNIVGEAKDSAEVVPLTKRYAPNLVLLSTRLSGAGCVETTRQLMIERPTPVVVLSWNNDERDVKVALAALQAGALAVENLNVSDKWASGTRLISVVEAMANVKVVRQWPRRGMDRPERQNIGTESRERTRAIAIAASTGGPTALRQLLGALPGDLDIPILIVQHIADGFIGGLVEWLNKTTPLSVKLAEQGEALRPRTVYVAPDEVQMGVGPSATISLSDSAAVGNFRPSASFLFDSVARYFGSAAAAVILTGMGNDGVEGLRSVRARGGLILAQDEATSVVFGMPGAAVDAGVADDMLPLEKLAPRLVAAVKGM